MKLHIEQGGLGEQPEPERRPESTLERLAQHEELRLNETEEMRTLRTKMLTDYSREDWDTYKTLSGVDTAEKHREDMEAGLMLVQAQILYANGERGLVLDILDDVIPALDGLGLGDLANQVNDEANRIYAELPEEPQE